MDKVKTDNLASKITGLMEMIPGYSGYQARATRRESDARQREFIARRLTQLKSDLQSVQEEFLGSGKLSMMGSFEKANNRLDRVIERVRHASHGYAGFCDSVQINEAELDRIYEYDLSLLNIVASAEEALMAVRGAADGAADPQVALRSLVAKIDEFDRALSERDGILKGIK